MLIHDSASSQAAPFNNMGEGGSGIRRVSSEFNKRGESLPKATASDTGSLRASTVSRRGDGDRGVVLPVNSTLTITNRTIPKADLVPNSLDGW
jgi:hypothetical protein